MVIITLYLCFGPCTEVHQNGYWKRCAAKITKRLKLLFVRDSFDGLALYDDIATGHYHDHIHLDVAFELFSVEKRMIYELLPCIKLFFNQFSAQCLLVDIFRHSGSQLSVDILHTANNAINILNEGLMKIRIEERTRNRQIIHVTRSTFTFYLQTTIQPLYFMRYAQFYALAIFFMYRL